MGIYWNLIYHLCVSVTCYPTPPATIPVIVANMGRYAARSSELYTVKSSRVDLFTNRLHLTVLIGDRFSALFLLQFDYNYKLSYLATHVPLAAWLIFVFPRRVKAKDLETYYLYLLESQCFYQCFIKPNRCLNICT